MGHAQASTQPGFPTVPWAHGQSLGRGPGLGGGSCSSLTEVPGGTRPQSHGAPEVLPQRSQGQLTICRHQMSVGQWVP